GGDDLGVRCAGTDPPPTRHRSDGGRLRPAVALFDPYLSGQGVDRVRHQPLRSAGDRCPCGSHGTVCVRVGRATRWSGRCPARPTAPDVLQLRRLPDRARFCRGDPWWTDPSHGRPGRRGRARGRGVPGGRVRQPGPSDHGRAPGDAGRDGLARGSSADTAPGGDGMSATTRTVLDRAEQEVTVPPPQRSWPRRLLLAVLVVGTLALPLALDSGELAVFVQVALSACVVVGISLLMGYAGQVSLGQPVFYGVGGSTAASLSRYGAPTLVGLLAAPLVAATIAVLLGLPLLRLRGHHLAFATIAVHMMFLVLVTQSDLLGGSTGLQGIPLLSVADREISTNLGHAYLAWAVLALVVIIALNTVRSRPGRALRALAGSETAAASSGIPVG